jgi:single-strand DNA-binding protein
MAGINKVILIGNLGNDPELRTAGSSTVCSLSVATTRAYFNKTNNERVEETEWHRVTVWGKDAENAAKYLTKGRQVYVEGRLQTREYEDKDGVTRRSTDVVAETIQYLGGKGGGDEAQGERGGGQERRSSGGRDQGKQRSSSAAKSRSSREEPAEGGGYYQSNPDDDDIPF